MNKKFGLKILLLLALVLTTSCGKKEEAKVDEKKIMDIANLATYDAYYHNLAKSTKEPGDTILNIGEVERRFWIEYDAVATLGIDASKIKIEQKGNDVTISLPYAEILGNIEIDKKSFDENSFVASNDGINKNKISAENQLDAIKTAQEEMKTTILNDDELLERARDRAKIMIENYINKINDITGEKYKIEWVYLDKEDKAENNTDKNSESN